MKDLPKLAISDYQYSLPDERIAKYPLPVRDQSRLLLWEGGQIAHRQFFELPEILEGNETLFFNNTRVIPARMFFFKETGGQIEVFLLSPVDPPQVELAMMAGTGCVWECTIGNLKRWKEGPLTRELQIDGHLVRLSIHLVDREKKWVRFEWDRPGVSFAALASECGQSPIPPYLNREAEQSDKTTYQTVYSKKDGAVAAPTAGLHFTDEVLSSLDARGIHREELTLHVSAGTFRPVKAENALEHDMHVEQMVVSRSNLEALLESKVRIAVGTTSMRTMESIYWYGVKLLKNPEAVFSISQNDPYEIEDKSLPSLESAIQAILKQLDESGEDQLSGQTGIYIVPGYRFRAVDGLLTNFHQPGSTLLLLIAAFTGGEAWKEIYNEALENDYRFLSYGDSSFLKNY